MAYGIQQMKEIIARDYAAWFKRGLETGNWKQEGIIMMRGPAGCGKTEVIYQLLEEIRQGIGALSLPAVEHAELVQLFFNAAMDPESIAGTPAPCEIEIEKINPNFDPKQPEGPNNLRTFKETIRALTMHYRGEIVQAMAKGPGSILLADEMGRDAPHMRACQLKLLSPEKVLAGLDMSPFYIICAGNPSDEQHKVDDIMSDAAMASRLISFDVAPNVEEWAEYMYKRSLAEKNPTFREVANFIIDNPSMLEGRDDENDSNSPYHSPRAWTVAAARLHDHGGGTETEPAQMRSQESVGFVTGAVGPNASVQLSAYLNQDRPMTVTAVLKGRFTVNADGRIADGVPVSVVRNLQYYLQTKDLDATEATNVSNFCKAISADIAHSINRNNKKIRPKNLMQLAKNGAFSNVLQRVKKLEKHAKGTGSTP